MNKGTKIALIGIAALALVGIVGLWSMVGSANVAIEKAKAESVTAGDEILVLLASNWNLGDIELRTARDFKSDLQQVDDWNRQFGPLVSGKMELTDFDVGSDLLTSKLAGIAEFEKGKGNVTMTLTREPRNSWMLSDFDVTPVP